MRVDGTGRHAGRLCERINAGGGEAPLLCGGAGCLEQLAPLLILVSVLIAHDRPTSSSLTGLVSIT